MTENLKSFYISYTKKEAKFVKRDTDCANLAEYDPTLNWVLERYLWVAVKPYKERQKTR